MFSEEDVDAVHQRIATLIDEQAASGGKSSANHNGLIDRFYYCPYHPEATVQEYRRDHPWRKPHPGMILQAARDMGLDLSRSWMIGDQERDILAGKAAGCRTVLFSRDADLAERQAHRCRGDVCGGGQRHSAAARRRRFAVGSAHTRHAETGDATTGSVIDVANECAELRPPPIERE